MDDKLREQILKKNIELIQRVVTLLNNDKLPIMNRLGNAYESSKLLCEDIVDRITYLNTNFSRKKFTEYIEYISKLNLMIDMYDVLLHNNDFDLNEQLLLCKDFDKLNSILDNAKEVNAEDILYSKSNSLFTIKPYVDATTAVGFNSRVNEFKRTSFVDKETFDELIEMCDRMGVSMNPRFLKPAVYKDEYAMYLDKYDGIVYNCTVEKDFEGNRVIQYGKMEIIPQASEQRLVYSGIFDNGIEHYNLLFDAR